MFSDTDRWGPNESQHVLTVGSCPKCWEISLEALRDGCCGWYPPLEDEEAGTEAEVSCHGTQQSWHPSPGGLTQRPDTSSPGLQSGQV